MRIGQTQNEPGLGRAVWSEQADRSGLVPQSPQALVTNLVALEMIQAAGVSAPFAPAKAFEWRLAAGDTTLAYKSALMELRLLLIAQFLGGLVEQVSYSLKQATLLANVLSRDLRADEIIVWVLKKHHGAIPVVLAGSVLPAYPLFPSAAVQLPENRAAVGRWLLEVSDGKLTGPGEDLRFAQAEQAERFRKRLNELRQDSTKINPNGPWYQALQRLTTF
jgi:hypothetical protein